MLTRNVGGMLWYVHSPSHYELVGFADFHVIYDGKAWRDRKNGRKMFKSLLEISRGLFEVCVKSQDTLAPKS